MTPFVIASSQHLDNDHTECEGQNQNIRQFCNNNGKEIDRYTKIRSVIDTPSKMDKDVFSALVCHTNVK